MDCVSHILSRYLTTENYHLTIVCVHMLDSIPKHMYLFGICLFVVVVIFKILLLLVSIQHIFI